MGQKFLFRENGDCRLVESSLGKRQRKEVCCSESDKCDSILSDICIDHKQPSKPIRDLQTDDLFNEIPIYDVRVSNPKDVSLNLSITTPQNDTLVGAPFNKKFKSIDSANFDPINSEEDFLNQ